MDNEPSSSYIDAVKWFELIEPVARNANIRCECNQLVPLKPHAKCSRVRVHGKREKVKGKVEQTNKVRLSVA